jgi:ribosomal protein S18 acetylase RimI-like enzyme
MLMPPARELAIRPFAASDEERVVALWHECSLVVPWNDPHQDIATKIAFQPELFLVGEIEERIVATVMAGYEGHRGWINYLAVDPSLRRRGLGRDMMRAAEDALRALGCPKVNLQVRGTNTDVIEFYQQLGFRTDGSVSLGKRLDGREW